MSSTYLPPSHFIAEVKMWGVTQGSINKVRMMGLNQFVYCKIHLPNEEIWTRVPKENQLLLRDLRPISVPAIWINEGEELKKMSESIKQLEDKNATN